MEYSYFINRKSASRKPSAIRDLQKLTFQPGFISLGGGVPHPSTFPVTNLSFGVGDQTLTVDPADLNNGLQYSQTVLHFDDRLVLAC
jgi:kynurenine/2-aminoadipate aminotransferase